MRVLFTCVIGYGHFHPMVPLARAFVAASHEVAFATDPQFCRPITGYGFRAFPAGLDHEVARSTFESSTPGLADLPLDGRMATVMAGMFARVRVPPMLADLGPLIERWRPDLLIHECTEMAGAIAAEVAGIAHAEHSFGLLRPSAARRLATETLRPISAAAGVPNPGVGGIDGDLYLDVCPPGIQFAEIADVPAVMPLRLDQLDVPPDGRFAAWIAGRPARPAIYLTMGTVFNEPAVFRTVLDGLSQEPLDVIVTVGKDADPAVLGPQPDNVYVDRFIPQAQVLSHSRVMVSHAGSGAMLGALNAAVPILAMPQGADQFMNAGRIADTGLGLQLWPADTTAEAVLDGVRRLIEEDGFADRAAVIQREIADMPSPASVVERLIAFSEGR